MIKFEQVTKRFGNGTVAFYDLSFEVKEGEAKLITGPSGIGKTTIMKLLLKEYLPTKGEIFFKDESLNQISSRKIPQHRQRIGVVFQDYKLVDDLNVWENIALPLQIKKEDQESIENRVTDLLKLVGLPEKALMFPKQLSGGESQRISIARALATGPDVIFADEPTGNLDQETGGKIVDLLMKINKLGTTLLLATHDPRILEKLDVKKVNLTKFQQEPEPKSEPESEIEDEDKVEKNKQEKNKADLQDDSQDNKEKKDKSQKTKSKKKKAKKIK